MKQQNRNRLIDTENILTVARWEGGRGGLGDYGEGIEKCRPVVTEQAWGCRVQHRE